MIWHPLVLAFGVAAATGALLYGIAAFFALDVASKWQPETAGTPQLLREERAEQAGLLGFMAFICLTVAAFLGLAGIARIWPRMISGAMCGTGVLQAMEPDGHRAIIFWSLGLMVLYVWRVLERIDQSHPQRALSGLNARVLLIAAPFLVPALFDATHALLRIEIPLPVSCCAALYDPVLSPASSQGGKGWFPSVRLWLSLAGAIVLPAAAVCMMGLRLKGLSILLPFITFGWALLSAGSVQHTLSAYYYQVLSHPCPWCLFLPDYLGAGFFIFGSLALAVLESIALWAAGLIRNVYLHLGDAAGHRQQQAVRRMTAAAIVFLILAFGPAIFWRIRNGVWLDGSP